LQWSFKSGSLLIIREFRAAKQESIKLRVHSLSDTHQYFPEFRNFWYELVLLRNYKAPVYDMKSYKSYYLLLLSVLLNMISIFLPSVVFARCHGLDLTIRQHLYEARAIIDESEDCSIGSYHLIIKTPDGKVSRFTAQREGWLQQMWFEPLNKNKQPSVILWLQSTGSGSYGKLDVYVPSVNSNNLYVRTKIAPLPPTVKDYQGHDQYTVTDGVLYLSFPRYKPNDPNYCSSDGQALFKYDFQNKKWVEQ
jgi:hypothetical protein